MPQSRTARSDLVDGAPDETADEGSAQSTANYERLASHDLNRASMLALASALNKSTKP